MANLSESLSVVASIEQHSSTRLFRRKWGTNVELLRRLKNGVKLLYTFDNNQCLKIEEHIDAVILSGDNGQLNPYTIDRSLLRNKYFFGERYTYGCGYGSEMLYPEGCVEPIPHWLERFVIKPLEDAKVLDKGFVNSAVINLYFPGGCIVSHIDPPQIFDRPILTVSFFSDTVLCFGCKFMFKPIRTSTPVARVPLLRGSTVSISGFAANNITHCIRPQDITSRRAAIILRRVLPNAPRLYPLEPCFLNGRTVVNFFPSMPERRKRRWIGEDNDLSPETKRYSKRARYDLKQK